MDRLPRSCLLWWKKAKKERPCRDAAMPAIIIFFYPMYHYFVNQHKSIDWQILFLADINPDGSECSTNHPLDLSFWSSVVDHQTVYLAGAVNWEEEKYGLETDLNDCVSWSFAAIRIDVCRKSNMPINTLALINKVSKHTQMYMMMMTSNSSGRGKLERSVGFAPFSLSSTNFPWSRQQASVGPSVRPFGPGSQHRFLISCIIYSLSLS